MQALHLSTGELTTSGVVQFLRRFVPMTTRDKTPWHALDVGRVKHAG